MTTETRTIRRRVRSVRPDVLQAIREMLLTGSSAPQVYAALSDRFPADSLPSDRTISNIAREMRTDDSGEWSVDDTDPATVGAVLRVLLDVVRRSRGGVTRLTRAEARLVPIMLAALAESAHPPKAIEWHAYLWARFYLTWVRRPEDGAAVTLLLAAMSSDGRLPMTSWPAIEHANAALNGWLPVELDA